MTSAVSAVMLKISRDGNTGMNTPFRMEESEFHQRADAVLAAIEAALEAAGADVDSEINGGILTLEFVDGGKIIVNRQTPNRELWVAARSGGFHFRFDGAAWRDTRSGEPLGALLSRVVAEQSGEALSIVV